MFKLCSAVGLVAFSLVACGGGGDGGISSQPAAKAYTISMYGKPLVSLTAATAHAQLAAVAKAASDADGSSDVQTTVQTLQDALAARGVTADVTPKVMDGTSLHALIMGEDNGLPPTQDQFKTDLSGAVIANFQLDDMVTPWTDPDQRAAATQFEQDLEVFIQRMHVAGKQVWIVLPIETCDYPAGSNFNDQYTARDALQGSILQAVAATTGQLAGGISYAYVTTQDPVTGAYTTVNTVTQGHLGADCRTPDAYLQNLQIQSVADTIAALYKETADNAGAASGASAGT
ncbi:hypothetical protein [Paraburkholderia sp. BCC1884]|uniref:hypothetical protein n=1 Tax=Paraburkholderia sp. BCC1884 TaxID=2562668 RepID=UPI001183FAFA|nr:hypothetical protein [Paraburkholderia sp. BCC1884]